MEKYRVTASGTYTEVRGRSELKRLIDDSLNKGALVIQIVKAADEQGTALDPKDYTFGRWAKLKADVTCPEWDIHR